jgi:hypothetical protein
MNLPAADANNNDGAYNVTTTSGLENVMAVSGTDNVMSAPADNAMTAVGHKQLPVAPTTVTLSYKFKFVA